MGDQAMAVVDMEKSAKRPVSGPRRAKDIGRAQEQRRGSGPRDSAYLQLVGSRVRSRRRKLGISRKVLSQKSGVSERYLAELERGSGNASLLVLRSVADALGLRIDDLAFEVGDVMADNDVGVPDGPAQKIGKVILVGLRGAGKSTLGQAAAQRFNVPFVELNDEVERVAGMDISEIFVQNGEDAYHALERKCLKAALASHEDVIVATGGGIVTDQKAFETIVSGARVVWVKTSPEVLFDRARGSDALKGVGLSNQARIEIRNALTARESSFAMADFTIDTTGKKAADTIEELVQILASERAG